MEVRANYVMVGAFALAVVVLTIAYAIWTAKTAGKLEMQEYVIEFSGDVSGLSQSSNVLFSGIRVGSVKHISISNKDSTKVEVLVEVEGNVPIRKDSVASLEMQGITGQTAVLISSGQLSSPILKEVSTDHPPIIASGESRIQQLFASVPEVLNEAERAFGNLNEVLSPENIEDMDKIFSNLRESTENLNTLIISMNKTTKNADVLISDLRAMTKNLDDNITLAGPGIARFSSDGLDEFRRLLTDTRLLINNFNRISNKMESEPRRFLFGSQVQEYKEGYSGEK